MNRPSIILLLGVLSSLACSSTTEPTPSPKGESGATDSNPTKSDTAPKSDSGPDFVRQNHAAAGEEILNTIAALRLSDDVTPEWPAGDAYPTLFNAEAPVPGQCYTRTHGKHNPCYVCHQKRRLGRENAKNDYDLQIAYAFSDVGYTNHWLNLFEDRSARIAAISDEEILAWVREDNYNDLIARMSAVNDHEGYVPDLANLGAGAEAFDEQGFALDGSGWVAFNYKPLPSSFWATNGATDDVMIRLPESFRQTEDGQASRQVYLANLSLVEMQMKDLDRLAPTPPLDEQAIGADLDGDGQMGTATAVVRRRNYVGGASSIKIQDTLYPQYTEFLHTVRYLDVDEDGEVIASRRLKEVRYMYRAARRNIGSAAFIYQDEIYDKEAGKLPRYLVHENSRNLESETGWRVSGFIEDGQGRLRANTFEETLFCMGCHDGIGATMDKTFSFPRKVDGAAGWGYINLKGMPDVPSMGETRGEIETYLARVGGGAEYRNNDEMAQRFYTSDGTLNTAEVKAAADVWELVTPSVERALALNKAYRVIVADQDFVFGRDPALSPPENVYDMVDPATAPTLPPEHRFTWDIRLDWSATAQN